MPRNNYGYTHSRSNGTGPHVLPAKHLAQPHASQARTPANGADDSPSSRSTSRHWLCLHCTAASRPRCCRNSNRPHRGVPVGRKAFFCSFPQPPAQGTAPTGSKHPGDRHPHVKPTARPRRKSPDSPSSVPVSPCGSKANPSPRGKPGHALPRAYCP